jgi:hypothetical protein
VVHVHVTLQFGNAEGCRHNESEGRWTPGSFSLASRRGWERDNCRNQVLLTGVCVEKVPSPLRFSFGTFLCVFLVLWGLLTHAVAVWSSGLRVRNRTSRFRFCAVAAR